jgi:hypothetical protein
MSFGSDEELQIASAIEASEFKLTFLPALTTFEYSRNPIGNTIKFYVYKLRDGNLIRIVDIFTGRTT